MLFGTPVRRGPGEARKGARGGGGSPALHGMERSGVEEGWGYPRAREHSDFTLARWGRSPACLLARNARRQIGESGSALEPRGRRSGRLTIAASPCHSKAVGVPGLRLARGFGVFYTARLTERIASMARPRGRQLPNRVSVALTDQQLAALESLAQESHAAVSWLARRAIAEFLERNCRQAASGASRTTRAPVAGNDDGTGDHQL